MNELMTALEAMITRIVREQIAATPLPAPSWVLTLTRIASEQLLNSCCATPTGILICTFGTQSLKTAPCTTTFWRSLKVPSKTHPKTRSEMLLATCPSLLRLTDRISKLE